MIIQNGTIEFKTKTGGGIDPVTGYPSAVSSSWGNPIPCQYIINSHDNLGMAHGEHFVAASYTVLVEQQSLSSEQLRIKDRSGATVGEFSIISVEQLDAVCQTKILV